MLTNFVKRQLVIFGIITVVALVMLGGYYLRIPSLVGIGQYELRADLPASGGLYATANVTYRGRTIGRVTAVEPTEHGAQATMSIDSRYKIPVDTTANVHSVSAVGEQYLDLVSPGNPGKFLSPGQTITKGTVPAEIGPALDAVNRGLAVLPKEKISQLLDETAEAVGGLGPALQRLVDATQAIAGDAITYAQDFKDIIVNSGPVLDSQANSGGAIERWARNLNTLAAQTAEKDQDVKSVLRQAAPTADQITAVFGDVRETLPQTLANTAIVTDMLKRYNKNVEQVLVLLPQLGTILQTVTSEWPDRAALDIPGGFVNPPPPCLTGFLPASQWRAPADTSPAELPDVYCKIPQEAQNDVRGVRNIPCVDVPGKRAPTPRDCRSDKPYVPLGTNPWYGDPNQIRNCPAPGARCDQPVNPGQVIQAPSVDTGMVPLQADKLPGTPPPVSDPLQRPGSGTVECNGQQPNPCIYTPNGPPAIGTYSPQSAEVVGPDGARFSVENSSNVGDDGWKEMLAPAS
ncbi:MCE family protein [Mycobacterium sp.]|uniref:MCE family protein n=1 Tax=Mycobacterium sp. TaxID=1785 RepID=UPI0031DA05B5